MFVHSPILDPINFWPTILNFPCLPNMMQCIAKNSVLSKKSTRQADKLSPYLIWFEIFTTCTRPGKFHINSWSRDVLHKIINIFWKVWTLNKNIVLHYVIWCAYPLNNQPKTFITALLFDSMRLCFHFY